MKWLIQGILGLVMFVLLASSVQADRETAKEVAANCKPELETFCKDVTPGKGRMLACLYAYSDQASHQCRETVRDAYEELKLLSAVSSHLKNECGDDLENFCSDVSPGQGRLMRCLQKNDENLSRRCKSALDELGLRD